MKTIISLVIAVQFLAGCSNVRVLSSWKADGIEKKNYRTLLVFASVKEEDPKLKTLMQDHLSEDLRRLGYNTILVDSVTSLRVNGNTDERSLIENLRGNEADAMVTIVLLDKKMDLKLLQNNFNYYAEDLYAYGYWGHSGDLFDRLYDPGRLVIQSRYLWRTSMFDIRTKKLLFSSKIIAYDYVDPGLMAHISARLLLQKMIKLQVLEKKQTPALLPF